MFVCSDDGRSTETVGKLTLWLTPPCWHFEAEWRERKDPPTPTSTPVTTETEIKGGGASRLASFMMKAKQLRLFKS